MKKTFTFLATTLLALSMFAEPISVAEAITTTMELGNNASSVEEYTVEGFVVNAETFAPAYGNQIFFLADDAQNSESQTFEAFACVAVDGEDIVPVLNGDKVQLTGKLTKYLDNSTATYIPEIRNGKAVFISKVEGDRSIPEITRISPTEAIELGQKLEGGQKSDETYEIIGYVSAISSNKYYSSKEMSFWIADERHNEISSNNQGAFYVYRGAPNAELKVGDKISVITQLYKYNSTIESTTIVPVEWLYTIIDGLYYDLDETSKTAIVIRSAEIYSCDIVIPETVTKDDVTYTVTEIENEAFCYCTELTSITIPNSVTTIGKKAFYYCNFFSITIPESVTQIGESAFFNIKNVIYSGTASGSPWGAVCANGFMDGWLLYRDATRHTLVACQTEATGEIVLPNGVVHVNAYAFRNCSNLTSIIVGEYLLIVERDAFEGCTNLTSVVWNAKTFSKTSSTTGPFYDIRTQITSFVFGETVEEIPSGLCYQMTQLTSITIPKSVTKIDIVAFGSCSNLNAIHISDLSAWCKIEFTDNPLTYAHNLYINGELVTEVVFPEDVTKVNTKVFDGCTCLTSAIIGDNVTSIGNSAFAGCSSLQSVLIGKNVESVESSAFANCTSLTSIQWNAQNCTDFTEEQYTYSNIFYNILEVITSFVFGNEVEHIPSYLCAGMTNLSSIIIPQNVTSIGEKAFTSCSGINTITWNTKSCIDFSSAQESPFYDIKDNISSFKFGYDVERIPAFLCNEMNVLTEMVIPEKVSQVSKQAFSNCSGLQSVIIGSGVTEVGDSAFAGINNRKFKEIILPQGVVSIGAKAFDGDAYLENVDFGASLEYIGDSAFYGCTRIAEMKCLATSTPDVGKDGLTSISSYAEVQVLSSAKHKYQVDPNWGRFSFKDIGATEINTTIDDVIVVPSDNTATLTWPIDEQAASYTIEITKEGEVFCRLIFDADGQLTGIAFAPSRVPHTSNAPSAQMVSKGMQFTVTGLNSGTNYGYNVFAKDNNDDIVASYNGAFTTKGELQIPTSVEETYSSSEFDGFRKLLRDGQVLIQNGEHIYTITGQQLE